MLDGTRVLDLTDDRGEVGPWLLGRLGAEVIKVEPPEGSPARLVPPLHDGLGIQFAAYNDNKRMVMLDPAVDCDQLLRLVSSVEVLFDSWPNGLLARFNVTEDDLTAANPQLIHVVISPFGIDGPRAEAPASELTIAALGGPMRIQGTPDRAPLKASVPQVWRHAGAEAAVAALVGRARRDTTGEGQLIDISAQSVMTWTMLNSMEAFGVQGYDFERSGAVLRLSMDVPLRHPASDGHVIVVPNGVHIQKLLPAMIEDGAAGADWVDEDFSTWDHRIIDGEPTLVTHAEACEALDAFCQKRKKSELLDLGMDHGVTIAPINDVNDLLAFEQLEERGFWVDAAVDVAHDPANPAHSAAVEGGKTRAPGHYLNIDDQRPAFETSIPELGRDTDAVLATLRTPPSGSSDSIAPGTGDDGLPLAGVKVADFSWIGVGPITAKALADHGATVVRIESVNRIDGLRTQPPFKDAEPGINRSNFWGSFNTSKQSISLDLKTEEGRATARKLADWADVVLDSFTPGAMSRLGLGPDELRSTNPNLITVTTSLLGKAGTYSSMAGYGYHAAAIAGFFGLVGWPDLPPDGPYLAYTDTIGPRFITPAILAALDKRSRTGEGCHIEAAQLEIALQFLAPELLQAQLAGDVVSANGNRDAHMAPQGVYPCQSDDCWIALTVEDDSAWRRLRLTMGDPEWAKSAMLDTAIGRLKSHDAIDTGISAWTITQSQADLEARLQEAGIAAGAVQRSRDLLVDPQYEHRGFYRYLEHAECGPTPYAGHQYRFRGYDNGPRSAPPLLGEQTFEILTDYLGLDTDDIAELAASGALE